LTGDEKNIDHLLAEKDFEFVKHDITQPINFKKLPELQKFKIEFQGIQEVYHAACPMSPKDFEKNKIAVLMANSYGMKNILDIAVEHGSKFLHFSSSVVYGHRTAGEKRVKETDSGTVDVLSERSSYDEGKRFAEAMVVNYREKMKVDTKIMRLFRTYGPRMKLNDGQMIPDFINDAIDNKDLKIFGDSSFSSSFCYISDCIDAALKLMDSKVTEPINIGSDVEVNLTELAKMVIAKTRSTSNLKYEEELLFMKPLHIPDISKARDELGWMPVVPLDKGLEKTIYELRASKGLKRVHHALRGNKNE